MQRKLLRKKSATQRNKPYRNATQAFSVAAKKTPQRNATQVPLRRSASVRKQIETSSIFTVRRKDDSQSEQPRAMT